MPIICLIGRHGSGKSTVGAALAEHGFRHFSVGLLRRLAKSNQYPADVPAVLMSAMRRERPGSPLTSGTAGKLINLARATDKTVLDGFPASADHAELLPKDTVFCVLWTPSKLRLQRLNDRAATTQRLWQPGRPSERESSLAGLIWHVRRHHRCLFIANGADPARAAAKLLAKLEGT